MKACLSIFRVRLIGALQYRAVLVGANLTRLIWVMMEVLAYMAIYRSAGNGLPMTFPQVVTYVWVQQTCLALFRVIWGDAEMYNAISDGSVAYELVRPMNLYTRWYLQSMANRVAFTALNSLPALLIAFLLPAPFAPSVALSLGQLALFAVSLVLASSVVCAFAMLVYASLFYTVSQRGIRIIVTAVTDLLSGGVIPLPFFPEPVLRVVKFLPFAAMENVPLRVFSGNLAGTEALTCIGLQIIWLAVLMLLGRLWIRRALHRVVVQGG